MARTCLTRALFMVLTVLTVTHVSHGYGGYSGGVAEPEPQVVLQTVSVITETETVTETVTETDTVTESVTVTPDPATVTVTLITEVVSGCDGDTASSGDSGYGSAIKFGYSG